MRRRQFIQGLGAAMALTAGGCRRPEQKAVPLVNPVEYLLPGTSNYYSTIFTLQNIAFPIIVETRDEKPIKIEANSLPHHSGAVSSQYLQAALYSLYDPDRFFEAVKSGKQVSRETALDNVFNLIRQGKTAIVTESTSSTALLKMSETIRANSSSIEFFELSALNSKNSIPKANKEILGIDAEQYPDLSKADVILSLDADIFGDDFLSPYFASTWFNSDDFENRKLIVWESVLTQTGISADYRIEIHPDEISRILNYLFVLFSDLERDPNIINNEKFDKKIFPLSFFKELIEYKKAGKRIIIFGGRHLSLRDQILIAGINKVLGTFAVDGAYGKINPILDSGDKSDHIFNLTKKIQKGEILNLIFLDSNPFYFLPNGMKNSLKKIPKSNRIAINHYQDETFEECGICIPLSNELEEWSDGFSPDGTHLIGQPVINPLNKHSISKEEILFLIAKQCGIKEFAQYNKYYDWFRNEHFKTFADKDSWEELLRKGFEPKSDNDIRIQFNQKKIDEAFKSLNIAGNKTVILIKQSHSVFDGRYANCAWLQELPDPITKQCWGNAVLMNRKSAENRKLSEDKLVKVKNNLGEIELPLIIIDEMADDVISISAGYGRKSGGTIAKDVGANVYALLSEKDLKGDEMFRLSASISPSNKNATKALTQKDFRFRSKELEMQFLGIDQVPIPDKKNAVYEYKGQHWGMLIDLRKCTGCGTCQIACQTENNIPSVGKDEIIRGRNMHWMNIERYSISTGENTKFIQLPLMCQHCENAPCESVCPVAATSHSPEGINEMTYNRCVGARFCMVNCPYKIRRFNFKSHDKAIRAPMENVLNPDVTVRMQGIAEKCTFCIQRINEARRKAKADGLSAIPHQELKTACQQACPTGAIIFGDLNSVDSEISKKLKSNKSFKLLQELNTNPSLSYISKSKNASLDKKEQL